ncbi:MAG: hypothetical protein ABL931_08635 [Usitatibacteraceae bacterium]
MRNQWKYLLVASALLVATNAKAGVDDKHGREWRQLVETTGLSATQIASVCPRDGVTACTGSVGSRNLTGWVWATEPQVTQLLSYYTPDILTNRVLNGWGYFGAASAFLVDFPPTQPSSNNNCTYCDHGDFGGGVTASTDASGAPIGAGVSFSVGNVGGIQASMGFGTIADSPSAQLGVFLWRPTGLGSNDVLANDDIGSTPNSSGGTAIANVLANDWVGGVRANMSNVSLSVVSSSQSGLTLDTTTGAVHVSAAAGAGAHTLVYRACSLAVPDACDDALVQVNVPYAVIRANADAGARSSATTGVAVASVLANDSVDGSPATLGNVSLALVSSSHSGITLNTGSGAVEVAQGTPNGNYALSYRICDVHSATNCSQATVTVSVRPNAIYAGNDSARASSKTGGVAIASVFANDSLNGVIASSASVTLSPVSALPKGFTLDRATGAVRVATKTSSGTYTIAYRICEIISPSNCAQATVTIDLSGKGG